MLTSLAATAAPSAATAASVRTSPASSPPRASNDPKNGKSGRISPSMQPARSRLCPGAALRTDRTRPGVARPSPKADSDGRAVVDREVPADDRHLVQLRGVAQPLERLPGDGFGGHDGVDQGQRLGAHGGQVVDVGEHGGDTGGEGIGLHEGRQHRLAADDHGLGAGVTTWRRRRPGRPPNRSRRGRRPRGRSGPWPAVRGGPGRRRRSPRGSASCRSPSMPSSSSAGDPVACQPGRCTIVNDSSTIGQVSAPPPQALPVPALPDDVAVVNVGLSLFAEAIAAQGRPGGRRRLAHPGRWRPRGGGRPPPPLRAPGRGHRRGQRRSGAPARHRRPAARRPRSGRRGRARPRRAHDPPLRPADRLGRRLRPAAPLDPGGGDGRGMGRDAPTRPAPSWRRAR